MLDWPDMDVAVRERQEALRREAAQGRQAALLPPRSLREGMAAALIRLAVWIAPSTQPVRAMLREPLAHHGPAPSAERV